MVSEFLSIDRHNHDVVAFNPVHAVHVQSRCNTGKKWSRKRCMTSCKFMCGPEACSDTMVT